MDYPEGDVFSLIDVLYLIRPEKQEIILTKSYSALEKGGFLIIKEMDTKPSWKYLWNLIQETAAVKIIGLTLGLAYGGGLIVKEAKSKLISKKDVFLSLSFMGLSHSLIEDTLLTLAIGASIFGILLGRVLFTILVMIIIVTVLNQLSKKTFERYFMNK